MSLAPCTLSDDDLIVTIASLAGVERSATASLIAHLAELETRNLHLAQGFRSLFGYCRHVLHCSEHEAYNRMEAVHAARRFPVILPMLAAGLVHLTAVRLLAPHLRGEDHLCLLGGAIHKSRREIVKRLACWFPSEDVPSSVRRLPAADTPLSGTPPSSTPDRLRHPQSVPCRRWRARALLRSRYHCPQQARRSSLPFPLTATASRSRSTATPTMTSAPSRT